MFDPKLKIGQILKNSDIVGIFKCGNMGGMRRSRTTNTLVIVSDYTKGLYHDKWIGGVLHYTGMGKSGNQDINWAQNATLAKCGSNGVDVHLFEVLNAGEYTYCGRVELVGKPYTETQRGEDDAERLVWMFPIRPVPDNDVQKPSMFVFSDMEDYKTRGKNVDSEYAKYLVNKKKCSKFATQPKVEPQFIKHNPKSIVEIPSDILNKKIKHKTFGIGIISSIGNATIDIEFEKVGVKTLGYDFCMENNMIEFIE